jgi:uncharacterized membrane protein YozB (DUF420 family)
MQKSARDVVILISVFLIGTGLLIAWVYSTGLLPRAADWQRRDVWVVFTMLAVAETLFLGLNVWAIRRGEFRWYREGVVTMVILMILCLILFPTLVVVRMRAVQAMRHRSALTAAHLPRSGVTSVRSDHGTC